MRGTRGRMVRLRPGNRRCVPQYMHATQDIHATHGPPLVDEPSRPWGAGRPSAERRPAAREPEPEPKRGQDGTDGGVPGEVRFQLPSTDTTREEQTACAPPH